MRYLHMKNLRKTDANVQNSPYEHTNFSRVLAVVPRQQYSIYNYAQNFAARSDFTCVCTRNFPMQQYTVCLSCLFLALVCDILALVRRVIEYVVRH